MTLAAQIEAVLRRSGGDFSEASGTVCRLLECEQGLEVESWEAELSDEELDFAF